MKISAILKSDVHQHDMVVQTDEMSKEMKISPQPNGFVSSVSGTELLMITLSS